MIYKQEMIGLKEGSALVFILATARVTLTSFAGVLARSGQAAWIQLALNSISAMAVIALIYGVYKMSGCKGDLHHLHQQVLGKFLGCLATLIVCLALIVNNVLVLRQYAENTIITAMPHLDLAVAVWLYLIVGAIAVHFSLAGVTRVARLFAPILVITFLGIGFFLYPFYIPYRLFPWQGAGLDLAVTEGLTGVGYNMGAIIGFALAGFFPNIQTVYQASIKGLALSLAMKIIEVFIYILAFGIEVGSERVMPFYEMARLIYLSRYFQHIEALLILIWVVLGVLSIAITLYLIVYLSCRLFQIEDARPLLLLMTLTMGTLALLPSSFSQVIELDRLFILQTAAITYALPVILFIVQWWRQKRSQSWSG